VAGKRGSRDDFAKVYFGGIVVALKHCERLVASNGHDAFVVPSFAYFPGDKGMPEVVEMKPVESSLTACGRP